MRKIKVLFAALVMLLSLILVAAPAAAQPTGPQLGSGQKIVMALQQAPTGDPARDVTIDGVSYVAQSSCTLAAVGNDKFGNKVGLTAGHCGSINTYVLNANGTALLGKIETRKSFAGTFGGAFEANVLDYAFIKLQPNVVMTDFVDSPVDVKSIVKPTNSNPFTRTQWPVCKFGYGVANGINNAGERCGLTFAVRPLEFETTVFVNFGDSGGPVYVNRTQLIGIVSRPVGVPYGSAAIMTRADAAVADATALNATGAGFVPVA